jgi:hypothetical protein
MNMTWAMAALLTQPNAGDKPLVGGLDPSQSRGEQRPTAGVC